MKQTATVRLPSELAALGYPLAVAVAYWLGAEAAFLVGTLSDKIFAPFWPPNVILLAALLTTPVRHWPLYIIACFPAHVLAELGVGMGWLQLCVAFATNCIVALLSAAGLRVLFPGQFVINSFDTALLYVLVAAIGSPAICALGGAFVRVAGDGDLAHYGLYWQQWFFSNALGSLTLGAGILSWSQNHENSRNLLHPLRIAEAAILTCVLILACIIAFRAHTFLSHDLLPARLYAPLPLVLWAAVRFEAKGASAAILVVTVAAIGLVSNGPTVFMSADAENNVLAIQIFLTALAAPVLLLAASIEGVRRAEETNAALARLVLGAQDDERRYVANTLHERIAQNMVAASWLVGDMRQKLRPQDWDSAKQLECVLNNATRDLCSVSYLLHPPLLEASGVSAALQALVDDYVKRHNGPVQLDISQDLGRLPPLIELATFRFVEEGLANLTHRAPARISVVRETDVDGHIVLTIAQGGRRISLGTSLRGRMTELFSSNHRGNLSMARMRERLRRVGGTIDIDERAGIFTTRARIPLAGSATSDRLSSSKAEHVAQGE
jgi:integral membrane sensor domain MASE1